MKPTRLTARRCAFKDISEYLGHSFVLRKDFIDIWYVTPYFMSKDKDIKRLNRQLGVHNINHFGNTNGKKNNNKN